MQDNSFAHLMQQQPDSRQTQQQPRRIMGAPPAPPTPDPRAIYEDERDTRFDQTDTLGQRFRSLDFVKEYPTVARQYSFALQTQPTPSGDQALIVAYAKMLDPGSVVREAEFDTTAAADSALGRTVSRIKRELGFEGGGRLSEEARNKVRSEMRTLAQQYDTQYQEARQFYSKMAQEFGLNPDFVVGSDYSQTYADVINKFWDEQDTPEQPEASSPQGISLGEQQQGIGDDGRGNPLVFEDPENGLQALVGYNEGGAPQYGPPDSNAQIDPRARGIIRQLEMAGPGGLADVRKAGITLGLSDEASGIGQAIGGALTGDFDVVGNYQTGRDIERFRLDQARAANPVASVFNEIGAGGAGIVGRAGAGFRAARQAAQSGNLSRQGVQQQLVRNARTEGAGVGALGGFGYGEGFEGSTSNALLGGVAGGAIGQGGQMLGNRIVNRANDRNLTGRATELSQAAGRLEYPSLNRAMIDPQSNNAITKADASLVGGRVIQRETQNAADEFEGAVERNLGAGGNVVDDVARGDTFKNASTRWIEDTGKIAKRRYDTAERLAGDAKVDAVSAIRRANGILRGLRETPETNAEEIRYIERVISDLAGPEGSGLSVGALRKMRTSLRKKISKGDLVFGEDEANVIAIMDAAAEDISSGLTAQGRGAAAEAFRRADTAYAARMKFIKNTVQKLIGPRQSNLNASQVASKINSLSTSDYNEFRKAYAMLEPEERLDMAATLAQRLGRKSTESLEAPFSVDTFLTNIEKMDPPAIRAVFGEDGARAVSDLKAIGSELKRVRSAMNSRSSKSGVAGYRDWLYSLLATIGAAVQSGSVTATSAVAAGGLGATAGKQYFSARLLMSPKITKWVRQAPQTKSPEGIDRHFAKLGEIARTEPAIANEVESLRRGLMQAANDNVGVAAVAEEDSSQ